MFNFSCFRHPHPWILPRNTRGISPRQDPAVPIFLGVISLSQQCSLSRFYALQFFPKTNPNESWTKRQRERGGGEDVQLWSYTWSTAYMRTQDTWWLLYASRTLCTRLVVVARGHCHRGGQRAEVLCSRGGGAEQPSDGCQTRTNKHRHLFGHNSALCPANITIP